MPGSLFDTHSKKELFELTVGKIAIDGSTAAGKIVSHQIKKGKSKTPSQDFRTVEKASCGGSSEGPPR